ncbi:hypothetical protein ACFR9R_01070 [Putridiphycobacter roseus]
MTEASDSSGLEGTDYEGTGYEGTGYEAPQVTEDFENGSLYDPQSHTTFFPTPQVTEASDSSGLEGTDYEGTDYEGTAIFPQNILPLIFGTAFVIVLV